MKSFFKKITLLSLLLIFQAHADTYPSKMIRIVEPAGPGSAVDNAARDLTQGMSDLLGQQVIIDNKPGANSAIGANEVARAPADGYTLLFTSNSAHLIGPLLKSPVPYDSVKDFTPLSMVIKYPMYLLVNPALPAKTIPEFIQYAKNKSNQLNYSSVGIGSGGHLACELFNIAAGTNVVHVPYKGAAPAQAALIGGETQMFCDSVGNSQGMVNAGKMRGLALFADKRSSVVPDVPTMGEMGLPGLAAYIWLGMLAPPNLPNDIQNKLTNELVKIMAMPEVSAFALKGGNDIVANTSAQFGQMMRDEKEIWLKVIREKSIKAE